MERLLDTEEGAPWRHLCPVAHCLISHVWQYGHIQQLSTVCAGPNALFCLNQSSALIKVQKYVCLESFFVKLHILNYVPCFISVNIQVSRVEVSVLQS